MKKKSILMITLLTVFALSMQTVSAQITITIPKFPKLKKDKPKEEQPKTEQTTVTTGNTETGGTSKTETTPAKTNDDDEMDSRLSFFLEEIAKAQKSAEKYTPEEYLYPVGGGEYEWVWRAVSMRERNEFYEKWKTLLTPAGRNKFETALNNLAAILKVKLPLYQPKPKAYNFRNPAEEKMMKGELENLASLKIHKIGLNQAAWLIDKNGLGIPTARYKHGMLWVRDSADDHQFCKFYYVNIIQDYAGGGTYGASYAKFVGSELAGCPAS